MTLTIGTRGRVTLPKELLEHLGVKPGMKIEVTQISHGVLRLSAQRAPIQTAGKSGHISDVFGILGKP